jgi:uncharacterized protein (TIGR00730 family)
LASARALGTSLASKGIALVYGGASIGLMGAIADAALEAGGEVIGVIPDDLVRREVAHKGLSDLRIVPSMHARKALMETLSDGFIALPGGLGTLEEFCEILTWGQLGYHRKPCGVLNVIGYFDPFLKFIDHMVSAGFLRDAHRLAILSSDSPDKLLAAFAHFRAPRTTKWIQDP